MLKIFTAIFLFTVSNFSQVEIGGMIDMQLHKGEANSMFFVNGARNANTSFFLNQLQVSFYKDIDTNISANVIVDATLYSSLSYADFYVYVASLSIRDVFKSSVDLELGKIITPFGKTSRFLSANTNPLIGLPLSHQYYSRISSERGYYPVNPDKRPEYDEGLPIIFQRPYFNGIKLSGTLASQLFNYDIGVCNQALSNTWGEIDLNNRLSFAGRVGVSPAMWLNAGVSYHQGPYMDSDTSVNAVIDVNSYKQISLGFDVNVNIYYYELQVEYISNTWNAPYIKPTQDNVLTKNNIDLNEQNIYVTLKVDLPFLPGAYIAGKYDKLIFNEITDPDNSPKIIRWNPNIIRTEIGAGYKIVKDVTAKIAYQFNRRDIATTKKYDAFLGQVFVLF